jgi:hypothetical protein
VNGARPAPPPRGALIVPGGATRTPVAIADDGGAVAAWVTCWGRCAPDARCFVHAASRSPVRGPRPVREERFVVADDAVALRVGLALGRHLEGRSRS